MEALRYSHRQDHKTWNRIPDDVRQMVVELSLAHPELTQGNSPFCFWRRVRSLSQNRVFIVFCVKEDSRRGRNTVLSMPPMSFAIRLGLPMRCGRPTLPTSRSRAGDCYYLSTVMDYYSRYIIHWELCSSMTGEDDSRTIDRAIKSAGLTAHNPPKLLSDN